MKRLVLLLAALTLAIPAWGDGQYIDLIPQTREDIETILDTLEDSIETARSVDGPPIVMMLHGKEADSFVRGNYRANKAIVDQTAKLAAYDVLDVKICETWMHNNGYDEGDLFPFVGTVPFGAGELERLEKEEGYTEIKVDL